MRHTNPNPASPSTKKLPTKSRARFSDLLRPFKRKKHVEGTSTAARGGAAVATGDISPPVTVGGGLAVARGNKPYFDGNPMPAGDNDPASSDIIISEILLRLHLEDSRCLLRVSLVCKRWHRIVCDPDFRSRYREFHRERLRIMYIRRLGHMVGN
ncbi:hypothetical protein ACP70R_014585 [Stipagrostis hirtigluma subsp. patula]